jgi:hypothetical protein
MATVLSTREKNSRQVVGFLDLPREIRQMIYKHIITEPALIIHYPHLAYQTPGTYHEYVSDDESDDSSIDPAKEEDERDFCWPLERRRGADIEPAKEKKVRQALLYVNRQIYIEYIAILHRQPKLSMNITPWNVGLLGNKIEYEVLGRTLQHLRLRLIMTEKDCWSSYDSFQRLQNDVVNFLNKMVNLVRARVSLTCYGCNCPDKSTLDHKGSFKEFAKVLQKHPRLEIFSLMKHRIYCGFPGCLKEHTGEVLLYRFFPDPYFWDDWSNDWDEPGSDEEETTVWEINGFCWLHEEHANCGFRDLCVTRYNEFLENRDITTEPWDHYMMMEF